MIGWVKAAVGGIGLFVVATTARAATLDFSSAPTGAFTSYTQSGFTVTKASSTGTPTIATAAGLGNYLALPGNTIIDVTGGLFQLGTFTYGNGTVSNYATVLTVTGYLAGAQVFTTTIDSSAQTYRTRDPMAGVTIFDRVRFNSAGFGDPLIDNIVVTQVPEPAAWTLMILGFGIMGAALRRQRNGVRAIA